MPVTNMQSYEIANVKVSVKISAISLDNVFTSLKELKYICKDYKNFIVLKCLFTYVIFKTNQKKENHINITKIPNLSAVQKAVDFLKSILNCEIKSITIDNIIATSHLNKKLNLSDIARNKIFNCLKYNNETFPGLFVKFALGTVILFHSGCVVILGVKNETDLACLLQKISVLM